MIKVFGEEKASFPNNSVGIYACPALSKPYACNCSIVCGFKSGAWFTAKKLAAIKPPKIVPTIINKFQRCAFQSKQKKSQVLSAPLIVQSVRKLDDIPKFLPT